MRAQSVRGNRPWAMYNQGMRPNAQLFEQLSRTINRILPRELAEDVRENVKGGIAGVLDEFDLVTREELEIQEAVLKRTREKLETLEAQVAELEQRFAAQPGNSSVPGREGDTGPTGREWHDDGPE